MKRLLILVIFLLVACDDPSGYKDASTHEPPVPPDLIPTNVTTVSDPFSYIPPIFSIDEWVSYANVGSSDKSICVIVWQTSTTYARGCRNYEQDGLWPNTCMASAGIYHCGTIYSIAGFVALMLEPARELTADEAAVAGAIAMQTYCTAPRLDGTAPTDDPYCQ